MLEGSPKLKFFAITLGLVAVSIGAFLFIGVPRETAPIHFGMTFSRPYAEELGLDPDKTLQLALDEVGIRRFRIPAYWKRLETKEGNWDFTELDKQIFDIGQRNGTVVLAIGEKLPRWPECWGPDWWKQLPRDEQRQKTLRYLETVVQRYRDNPTVSAWQVENEAHFYFGDCPFPDFFFLPKEVSFVRGLDPSRPILTTDSGELSTWLTVGPLVDKLGVSVYRVVRNPFLGDFNWKYWFLPPYFYHRRALLLRPFGVKEVYVSEFQMEPWSNTSLPETPVDDQIRSMSIPQMRKNFHYAERMEFPNVDFWGIEWWVWMAHTGGHPEYLEEAKTVWKKHP
jgi:hypothetical protein